MIKPLTIVLDNQALAMYMAGIESPEMVESRNMERDTSETSQDFSVYDVNPEEEVFRVEGDRILVIELKVAKEDMGTIIGKQGRNVQAIRTILGAASGKVKKRTILEIIE